MAKRVKREVPPELAPLIPSTIQKGIYYRLYPLKDGTTKLVWWVKAYDHQGRPIYESTNSSSYEAALKHQRKITGQIESQQRSGGDTDSIRIGQLLDEFLQDGTNAKPDTLYVYRLVVDVHMKPFFGKLRASKLTTDHTKAYRKKRKAELIAKKAKLHPDATAEQRAQWEKSAGATVNRELSQLHAALEYGAKQSPPKIIRIPHFHKESEADNVRKVVLQDSDYAKLRDAFSDPGVQLLFIVSSHTGIRASELKRITWAQVDFNRKVIVLEKNKTKNKDSRSCPIYGDMVPYLAAAKAQHDEFYPGSKWVFSRAGQPIKDFRRGWDDACKTAGVPDLHFHDLRRTAQRLMRRAGIDRITRMRIMGHRSDSMDVRYGVIEDADVVEAGVKLEDAFQSIHRNGDRSSDSPAETPGQSIEPDVLSKLATLPSGKLKALLALLGD